MIIHIGEIMIEKCKEIHCAHISSENLPDKCVLCGMSKILKAMSDMTRLKILFALCREDCCVCELQQILNASQSLISHQLKILKELDLVKSTRYGNKISYSLSDEHIVGLINLAYDHIIEAKNEKNI